jgi:hypothetical protein
MASRHHQGDEGEFQAGKIKKYGRHMAQDMIDPHDGQVENVGQGFSRRDADKKRTHQARPLGDRDALQACQADFGLRKGFLDDRQDGLHMLAGSQLRNHSPVFPMDGNLGSDGAGSHFFPILHHCGGSLIAGGFNCQNVHSRVGGSEAPGRLADPNRAPDRLGGRS